MICSKNLCNQHFSKELQLFGCNEDKPMLMLFKMGENGTKDHLWQPNSIELLVQWETLASFYQFAAKLNSV